MKKTHQKSETRSSSAQTKHQVQGAFPLDVVRFPSPHGPAQDRALGTAEAANLQKNVLRITVRLAWTWPSKVTCRTKCTCREVTKFTNSQSRRDDEDQFCTVDGALQTRGPGSWLQRCQWCPTPQRLEPSVSVLRTRPQGSARRIMNFRKNKDVARLGSELFRERQLSDHSTEEGRTQIRFGGIIHLCRCRFGWVTGRPRLPVFC